MTSAACVARETRSTDELPSCPDLHVKPGRKGYRRGKTVWNQCAGSGLSFNNNYAGLALGPDPTAYLGVIGAIAALRDGA